MLKRNLSRVGAILGALLIAAALVLASPVFARQITVDGNPADWVGSSIPPISDANEPTIGDQYDISQVFYTYTTSNLFFRVDTFANTGWDDGTRILICLNTDNLTSTGRSIDQCEADDTAPVVVRNQEGVDYVIAIDEFNGTYRIRPCPGPGVGVSGCPTAGAPSADFDFLTNVNEIGVSFANINLPPATCPGTTITIPASVYFDNGTGAEDDNVPDAGEFNIILSCPLPVTLTSLIASRTDGGIKLAWETASEIGIQGYHVLRSATGSRADATRITTEIIQGEGSGVTGASYTFTDAAATPGSGYSYWLEVINSDGSPEEYGPVRYTPGTAGSERVHLPLVRR